MKIISCLLIFMLHNTFAGEVDHFTKFGEPLEEVSEKINSKANFYLKKAIADLNKKNHCDSSLESEKLLYKELRKYFANHFNGELSKYVFYDEEFSRMIVPLEESVYKDWSYKDGFVLANKTSNSNKDLQALSPLVNIKDVIVGVDKLEHMFGMGFLYFKRLYHSKRNLGQVLRFGELREKFILGGNIFATGIFSYADLSANFNGMRFWNHILQKRNDILGKEYNLGPYIQCSEGKWEALSEIKFENYVDHSMDESLNCSDFASSAGLEKFNSSLKELNSEFKCPMNEQKVNSLKEKYSLPIGESSLFERIINTKPNGLIKYF